MKIALGADSAGKPLLDVIAAHLAGRPDIEVTDLSQSGYYADLAARIGQDILEHRHDRAILFCGTGIGVCISANKVAGYTGGSDAEYLFGRARRQIERRPDNHTGSARRWSRTGKDDRRYLAGFEFRSGRPIGRQCSGE